MKEKFMKAKQTLTQRVLSIGEELHEELVEFSNVINEKDDAYKTMGGTPEEVKKSLNDYQLIVKDYPTAKELSDIMSQKKSIVGGLLGKSLNQAVQDAQKVIKRFEEIPPETHKVVKTLNEPVKLELTVYRNDKDNSISIALPITPKQSLITDAFSPTNAVKNCVTKAFYDAILKENITQKSSNFKTDSYGLKIIRFKSTIEEGYLEEQVERITRFMNEESTKKNSHKILEQANIKIEFIYDRSGSLAVFEQDTIDKIVNTKKEIGKESIALIVHKETSTSDSDVKDYETSKGMTLPDIARAFKSEFKKYDIQIKTPYNTLAYNRVQTSKKIKPISKKGEPEIFDSNDVAGLVAGEVTLQRLTKYKKEKSEYIGCEDFCEITNLSSQTYFRLMKTKYVKHEKIGNNKMMRVTGLRTYLERHHCIIDKNQRYMWKQPKLK
ncbi:MAG: hypothetical protein KKF65_06180 [Nanoarchaeota archaeon]|nr:hypothetical protein [Nanoarchaeota archaeon]